MVKSNPRIRYRGDRKENRLERKRITTTQETQNPSPISINRLKRRSTSSSPSPSPPPSSSLSSPETLKPTSNSTISGPSTTQSLSGHQSLSDLRMPKCPILPSVARNSVGMLPPLPPPPSKQLLRTVSDPVLYGYFTPPGSIPRYTTPKDVLGPVSPGSGSIGDKSSTSRRLRRMSKKMAHMKKVLDENGSGSVSKPIHTCSCCLRNDNDDTEKGKIRERAVRAERLAEDWIMIIINCPCGSDYQFMVSKAEKKCYYKLV